MVMSKNMKECHEATKEITEYRSIDGNWIKCPVGYCSRYKGYITEKQAKVHGCLKRHGGICGRFQTVKGEYVKRMNQQQFYDKMLSRMDKMATSLDKIARSLEAISKSIDTKGSRIILDNTLARLRPENTSSNIDMSEENA